MMNLGMSPLEAMCTATVNPAELLDIRRQIGVIAPGACADVIAVAGNPLKDISELGRVKLVMKDGKVYKNEF